jgi:hypothetical protein
MLSSPYGGFAQVAVEIERIEKAHDDDWLDDELVDEGTLAKMDQFGPDAARLEANLLAEVEKRARLAQAVGSSLTREQAIAKVFIDTPDIRKVNRLVQSMKAKASKLRGGDTVAKAVRSRQERTTYAQEKIEDQQAAMTLLYDEADVMVREGRAPTREQAIVELLRDVPEVWRAWNQSFREPA